MKTIGKLESDEGEKFRVKRLKKGRHQKNSPRVPARVEIWSTELKQWNEAATFDVETQESARKGRAFVQRKSDLQVMELAREKANWVADGEVFLSQKWAEKQSFRVQ